ncbi:phosphatase PAP2 family protein [Porphyrobacter sp. GA68]|uniref:phosphatase PAP2 family protein n=1 Tax=Porphyrobacter sp. GA68 TaxID=2883480 RepID=UPI001D194E64|nr:phosphatase PAP2 family protein [Porphyrobacter sp. GA68]
MNDHSYHLPEHAAGNIAPPARAMPLDARKLFVASGLCWAAFAVVTWLALNNAAAPFDRAGLLWWRAPDGSPLGPAWLAEAVRDVTALGGVLLRNLFVLTVAAALLFLRLRREAGMLVATVAGGWAVNTLLKGLVARERPAIVPHLMEAGGMSFPSGHSFNGAVAWLAVALALATLSGRQSVRRSVVGAALLLSAAIAWSRVWLGVHYPTDVIAGWLGGVGWAFMAAALASRIMEAPVRTAPAATRR